MYRTYLQIKQPKVAGSGWDSNECHRWMIDVEHLLEQRLNEFIIDMNASIGAQKWIRIVITLKEPNKNAHIKKCTSISTDRKVNSKQQTAKTILNATNPWHR